MAKQYYEKKQIVKIVGTLDKNEDGNYIIVVENADSFKEYEVEEILETIVGTVISLQSEETL